MNIGRIFFHYMLSGRSKQQRRLDVPCTFVQAFVAFLLQAKNPNRPIPNVKTHRSRACKYCTSVLVTLRVQPACI